MLVKIKGKPQKSFEQFRETFRLAFGRDMTPDLRQWLQFADFSNDSLEQRSGVLVAHALYRETHISKPQ